MLNNRGANIFPNNILTKVALEFYTNMFEPHAVNYQNAVYMFAAKYGSAVREEQIPNYLDNLSADTYTENGPDELQALAK